MNATGAFRSRNLRIRAGIGKHSLFIADERTFTDDGCTFIDDECTSADDE